ncbi:MAG: alpha/beta hydrolase [Woeseiaceae bacterium]|nr:alpha/beta hydrolase [Woeseiaceae bacterium]
MPHAANSGFFKSHDGLNLYYRDFGAGNPGTPLICLPGLTRNSRDFEDFAVELSERRRVLTTDFRGRGYSDYDPEWQNYHPHTYVRDVWTLLDMLGIERIIVIGTSLGGLCAMAMATLNAGRLAGVVLNDIGPELNPAGIERVRQHAGRTPPVNDWDEAVEQTKLIYGDCFPGLSEDDWQKMAWRAYREVESEVPRLDMDDMIGEAIRTVKPQSDDPWPFFDALANVPTTLLWGLMSDILTKDIVKKMQARKPDLEVVQVPNRGHVPLLDEPECIAGIDALLAKVP